MRTLISIVLLASAGAARADRVAVTAGAGVTHHRHGSYHLGRAGEANHWGPGVSFDITYRVIDQLAVGAHFAVARSWTENMIDCPTRMRIDHYAVTPALLGVTAKYTIVDRVWLAPWIGVLDTETRHTGIDGQCDASYGYDAKVIERQLAYGIGIGVDVVTDNRHRLGPYFQLARSRGEGEAGGYPNEFDENLVIAFGVAYRYW